MGKNYHQLTPEDRVGLCHLLRAGHSKSEIAVLLGVHRSTIYRELCRNSHKKLGYLPIVAERYIQARRKRAIKLNQDSNLRQYVLSKLKESWSPEQIAGRLKLKHAGKSQICHETIYAYIYSDYGIRNKWYFCLRRKRLWRYPKVSRPIVSGHFKVCLRFDRNN